MGGGDSMKCPIVEMKKIGIGILIGDAGVRGGGKGFVLRARLVLLGTSWLPVSASWERWQCREDKLE